MSNRPIVYDQSQGRSYDVLHGWRESLYGLGQAVEDLLGSSGSVVGGLGATSNNTMTIALAAGEVYALAALDTTAYGSLTSDATLTMQQGFAVAQNVVLSTTGISAGQSRYTLIYASFSQTDVIPADDPNAGVLNYINATNPAGPPWSGPANAGTPQNTRRTGVCVITTTNGSPATTGSEVPPNPPGGGVPLYLVDLAFGQSQISQTQILVAGPSAGTGVPSNYAGPSFLAGLQQKLTFGTFAGNPNGLQAGTALGTAGSPAWPNIIWDTVNKTEWLCVTSGSATNAVWQTSNAGIGQLFNVAQFTTSTRTSMTGNAGNAYTVQAWAPGSYVKQSNTSKLVIWLAAPTYAPPGTAPSSITLTIGGQSFTVICVNNQSGDNRGATILNNIFTGLAKGSQAITLSYTRSDATGWVTVFCPNTSDAAYLPASLPATLVIAELGA